MVEADRREGSSPSPEIERRTATQPHCHTATHLLLAEARTLSKNKGGTGLLYTDRRQSDPVM